MVQEREDLIRICLVEDDPLVIRSLSEPLKQRAMLWNFESIEDLLGQSKEKAQPFDLIFLDLRHAGDPSGQRSIAKIPDVIRRWQDALVVVASGVDDLDSMRSCIAQGADRFISKEGLLGELPQLLSTASAWRERRVGLDQALVGDSQTLRSLKRDLFRLQTHGGDVLLEGETGSGKELCARALMSGNTFVGLNVMTVPVDLFESTLFGHEKGAFSGAQNSSAGLLGSAQGGTLFLDEIQSLNFEHQGKLLRFLETREYFPVGSQKTRQFKGRVIFASNRDLYSQVQRGEFREDLYFRVGQITLKLPPLRARRGDIPGLIDRFLQDEKAVGRFRFSSEGLDFMMNDYEWPGNVRELKGLIRSFVATSKIPIWGRSEIEDCLRAELRSSLDGVKQQMTSQLPDGELFRIDWGRGLDQNIDRLTQHMLLKLLADADPNAVQQKLGLKKSRFYELLRRAKVSGNS